MRRAIDILIACLVLPLISPLLVPISLAIVLESPGGPFYGGWRIGRGGRRFRMWKFRTMVKNADRTGGSITTRNDSRITKVGAFLRKTKLDELPQFFNLLLGDLTLIGPRPEDPGIVEKYTPQQRQILQVKPGITGPTQLKYTMVEAQSLTNESDSERFYIEHLLNKKVLLDLEYIRKRTVFSDCRVVLQTVLLMVHALTQRGATLQSHASQPTTNSLPETR
jgi:lipopolysaccharide/colanic/teichoic acid biosynthesis glycosyltransferase